MIRARLVAVVGLAAVATLTAGSARASCVAPNLFNTGYSYVYTPGCESVDCGSAAASVTDDLLGNFWILGDGNPELFRGLDNGPFPALGGWVYTYPGYPAIISSSWPAHGRRVRGRPEMENDPKLR